MTFFFKGNVLGYAKIVKLAMQKGKSIILSGTMLVLHRYGMDVKVL